MANVAYMMFVIGLLLIELPSSQSDFFMMFCVTEKCQQYFRNK